MTTTNEIQIPLSKGKLTLMLMGSILFVSAGLWFLIKPPKFENSLFAAPTTITIVGIASILFFGLCAFFISFKLKDNKAGLIINADGITDNASAVSAGFIPWNDIKEFKTTQVFNQKFLMIIVNNPNDYINRKTNVISRKAMEINFKSYGSPISISANGLKCNFDELKNILEAKFKESKS